MKYLSIGAVILGFIHVVSPAYADVQSAKEYIQKNPVMVIRVTEQRTVYQPLLRKVLTAAKEAKKEVGFDIVTVSTQPVTKDNGVTLSQQRTEELLGYMQAMGVSRDRITVRYETKTLPYAGEMRLFVK